MDLLGSILGSMKGPPSIGAEEKKAAKAQKDKVDKMQAQRKRLMLTFRQRMEEKLGAFCKDDKKSKLELGTMSQVERKVVHEVAEIAGLVSHAFGEEGVDRHLIVWRKEGVPCDAELAAMKAGVAYDPSAKKEVYEPLLRKRSQSGPTPNSDYRDKYSKILGTEGDQKVALSAAEGKVYGCVPSALKRGHSSIEDTLNAIQARKKQKPAGTSDGRANSEHAIQADTGPLSSPTTTTTTTAPASPSSTTSTPSSSS